MSDAIKFLRENREHLKISSIEKATEIPQSTISSAMSGRDNRTLTQEQEDRVNAYLRDLSQKLKKYLSKKFGG